MSLIAISLTIQQKIADPLAKFLLLLLADRHNGDTGECFPSIPRLTEDSGMSRSTVIRKLQWLQEAGFVTPVARTRNGGSQASNNYVLHYVPQIEILAPTPKRLGQRLTPPEDWRPRDDTIEKLRKRYPHHDTSDDAIDYLVREWLQYCEANGRTYVQFDAAWLQSAERQLKRQSARPSAFPKRAGYRGGAGSLSGAIRRVRGAG